MNGTRMAGGAVIAALVAMAFTAGTSQAQSSEASNAKDLAKAAKYEATAQSVQKNVGQFAEAARYYEAAAKLRPTGDQNAVEDMVNASRLKFYLGDKAGAQYGLEHAGDIALQYGDVHTAAKCFLDAAWVAQRRGSDQAAAMRSLLTRARNLAQSPLLDSAARDALLGRIASDTM